jgi:hypothetical protein
MPAGTRVVEPLDSWEQGIPYRIADGLAADWLERRPITTMSDDPTARERASLIAEARRQLSASGPVDDELIREAVADALNGRRPRW